MHSGLRVTPLHPFYFTMFEGRDVTEAVTGGSQIHSLPSCKESVAQTSQFVHPEPYPQRHKAHKLLPTSMSPDPDLVRWGTDLRPAQTVRVCSSYDL